METSAILVSALILGGVAAVFGGLIAAANRRFRVDEDPRIDAIEEMLPGTNCGACGTPGCRAFAEGLIDESRQPAGCTVMGPDDVEDVAAYLGVAAGEADRNVARLLCAGGSDVAAMQAEYQGHSSCQAAAMVSGGGKSCSWGCLGLADCEIACDFNAIFMSASGLPIVVPELCTACNDCVEVCPKDLFVLMPLDQSLIVQCKSLIEGDGAIEHCEVACTGCGLCAKDAPEGAIAITDGLAVVDYAAETPAGSEAIQRCPTQAIVWVEGAQFPGHKAPDRRIKV